MSRPIFLLVLALLKWLRCQGSLFDTTQGAMSGIVQKRRCVSICFAMCLENCLTCVQIYCKNALLDHLPMSMMVYTGTQMRYISIAAPKQREWVLILIGSKPRQALPMVVHAARSMVITCCDDVCSSLPWRQPARTWVSCVVPGYVQIRLTRHANWKSGQSVVSSHHPWITVSCLWSFFCISNVTATLLASSKLSNGIERRCPSLKNLLFCMHKSFVHCVSYPCKELSGICKKDMQRKLR